MKIMKTKSTAAVIAILLLALLVCAGLVNRVKKGTIIGFADEAVIVALSDGKSVVQIEDYLSYLPSGAQISIGDPVKIKTGFFNDLRILSIQLQ